MPESTPSHRIEVDVAVVGGGIAGLWLLNRLRQAGYSALLVEKNALGHGQTIASQGMIHGGLKYALAGSLTGESEAIKQMPAIWDACLRGEGENDLSQARKLSDNFYLWSSGKVASRLVSYFASKSLRGRVDKVKPAAYPSAFADTPYKGTIYRLQDVVLDIPDLLAVLSRPHTACMSQCDNPQWLRGDHGIEGLQLDQHTVVQAQRFVITAGEGAGQILEQLGIAQPAMQLRPLKQVMVKHTLPHRLYGHCIGAQTSASPRLTVSSHPCKDGSVMWYLGGDLATEGVHATDERLIDHARAELAAIFPWLDFSGARWATHTVNRAEPQQHKLIKPDSAYAGIANNHDNVIVAWPTKLTLAPDLAARTLDLLQTQIQATPAVGLEHLDTLPKPAVATTPWDQVW